MAGQLGRVPSEGDLINRFKSKGDEISVATARDLIRDVTDFRSGRSAGSTGSTRSRSSGREEREEVKEEKSIPKRPEIERRPAPRKHSTSYGY